MLMFKVFIMKRQKEIIILIDTTLTDTNIYFLEFG